MAATRFRKLRMIHYTKNIPSAWKNPDEIVELNKASANFDSIAEVMKKLGQELYSWENIAEKYNALF